MENVVNPPQNPTARKKFISEESADFTDSPIRIPMIRQPTILTTNVPVGKDAESGCVRYFDNRKRLILPRNPPLPTNSKTLNIKTPLSIDLKFIE